MHLACLHVPWGLQSPHEKELRGTPRTGRCMDPQLLVHQFMRAHGLSQPFSHWISTTALARTREQIGSLIFLVIKMRLTGKGSDLPKVTQLNLLKDLSPDLLSPGTQS